MLNPRFELDRLRSTLTNKGIQEDQVNFLCDNASKDINIGITQAVADALEAATEAGLAVGAYDFVDQLRAGQTGDGFQVMTESGNTDFSYPPLQMMASLLKNPKVAKDGTLYKVIPMGGNAPSTQQVFRNQSDAQANIASSKRQAMESWKDQKAAPGTSDPTSMPLQFSGIAMAQKAQERNQMIKQQRREKVSRGTSFRTVTSKQNPQTQWVLPAKDMNMTDKLEAINSQLTAAIDDLVFNIVRYYEESV